jgi:rRNA maturation endonuclease Nob1
MTAHPSPEYFRRIAAEEWNRRFRFSCECPEREVRAEPILCCAQCGKPILRQAVVS